MGLILKSKRLILREFEATDFAAVHTYATDPEVVRYMSWGPNTETETNEFLAHVVSQSSQTPRSLYDLAVVEMSSGRLVGGVGLHLDGPQAMLGYCYARSAWGQGYATEAAHLLVDYGFEQLVLHRVWARCDVENVASVKVLEKLGLRREGLLKEDCQIRGDWRDTLVYAVLKDEWTIR